MTGCSAPPTGPAPTPPEPDRTGPATTEDGRPEAEPENGGDDGAASGSGPAAPGTVLGTTADVPVGGGAIYPAAGVVVTQPVAGTFVGFSAVCTHQACTVSTVANGTIDCPCHGSRYHLDGTVAAGPAPRPLDPASITVRDKQITLG